MKLLKQKLLPVLDSYPLPRIRNISKIKNGFVNENFIITTAGGKKYVLRCINSPSISRLKMETNFIQLLFEYGVGVPEIILGEDKKYTIHDGNAYILFDFIPGKFPRYSISEVALLAGSLARLHVVSEAVSQQLLKQRYIVKTADLFSFDFSNKFVKLLQPDFIARYPNYAKKINWATGIMERLEKKIHFADKEEFLIHNDLNRENILLSSNHVCYLDFDAFCKGSPVSDVASAIYYALMHGSPVRNYCEKFIQSYCSIRSQEVNFKLLHALMIHQGIRNVHFLAERKMNNSPNVDVWLHRNLRMIEKLMRRGF